jgi:hypothetical protein
MRIQLKKIYKVTSYALRSLVPLLVFLAANAQPVPPACYQYSASFRGFQRLGAAPSEACQSVFDRVNLDFGFELFRFTSASAYSAYGGTCEGIRVSNSEINNGAYQRITADCPPPLIPPIDPPICKPAEDGATTLHPIIPATGEKQLYETDYADNTPHV